MKTYGKQLSEASVLEFEARQAADEAAKRAQAANTQFDEMFRSVDFREWLVAIYMRDFPHRVGGTASEKPADVSGLNSVVVGASPQALVEANRALNQAIAFLGNLDAVGQPFGVRDSAMSARRLCLDAIGFVEALHKELTRGK